MMRPVMLGSIVQKLSWGNLVLLLSLLHPAVALSAVVAAIPIVNPSFEAQSLPIRTFTSGAITGWTAPGGQGTFRPSAFEYNGGGSPGLQTSPALGVPSGVNVAYSNGGRISQILNESLTAGRLYKLQVSVGDRLDQALANYEIQLAAGGEVLARAVAPHPPDGAFITDTLTFIAPQGHSMLGQLLEIRLVSSSVQVNFDNVLLTATTVPEPHAARIFAAGLLALFGFMHMRRKLWRAHPKRIDCPRRG